jgi:F420-0:gamma-glutamyl ligase-like protein
MTKYKTLAVTTEYWRPGENYVERIIESIRGKIHDGDFLVISEKAISTAIGNIVNESQVRPTLRARLIARYWMRVVWGYLLGPICHFQGRLLQRLREYPLETGSRHKQIALQSFGLLQALMFGSEGGIDGSNLPYSYVSLPLANAEVIAEKTRTNIWVKFRKRVFVLIVDTDKTYSLRNFHFTPRPRPLVGIHSFGGFITYVAGRMLGFRKRATPIAVSDRNMSVEEALEVAEAANRARGYGAGRTVWEMAEKFNVRVDGVSWEMLETVRHKPIVIVRGKR